MGKVNIQFRFFQNIVGLLKFPAIIAGVGYLTQGLSALAAAATAVVGALGPLSGLVLAAPAGILALVTALGTLKLAFSDVKAAMDAQKEGTTVLAQARATLKDAEIGLQEALVKQREVIADAGKGSLEYREASLKVRDARNDVAAAERAATLANSDGMRAAQKFAGFIDAKLTPALGRLKSAAAEGVLPGVQAGATAALRNLPAVQGLIRGAGAALGQGAIGLGQMLGGREAGRDITQIGKTNRRVIADMAAAATSLASALLSVSAAAGPFLKWVSAGVREFGTWAERAAHAGQESGRLAGFLESTKNTIQLLWGILRPFGSALINIFKAAAPLGRDLMESLGTAAEGFEKWTASVEGQNRLKEYFDAAKEPIEEIGRLIRDLVEAFFRLGDSPGFADLVRKIRTELLPVLEELIRSTTEGFGPALLDAIISLAKVIGQLAGASGPLTQFVKILGGIFEGFNKILEVVPGLRGAFVNLIGLMATLTAIRFVGLISGLGRVVGLMRGIPAAAVAAGMATGPVATVGAFGRNLRGGPGAAVPAAGVGAAVLPPRPVVSPAGIATGDLRTAPPRPTFGQRFGAPAAMVGGLGAAAVGSGMGGVAGGILGGAGLGAAVGSAFAPVVGTAIGAGAGALLGGLTALIPQITAAGSAAGAAATQMNLLGQSMTNATTAEAELDAANVEAEDSALSLEGAELQLERAQKTRQQTLKTFGRNSLEYKEAVYGVKLAEEALTDAQERAAHAQAEQARKRDENRERTEKFNRTLRETVQHHKDEIAELPKKFKLAADGISQVRDYAAEEADRTAKVKAFSAEMGRLAAQTPGRLGKVARAAQIVAQRINDIPTEKQIRVEVAFQARFESFTTVETNRFIPGSTQGSSGSTGKGPPSRTGGRIPSVPSLAPGVDRLIQSNLPGFLSRQRAIFEGQSASFSVTGMRPFAGGGRVPGARQARDSVPAMLSPQEFVVTGGGEKMLEGMTFPGVLDWLGNAQPAHFQGGGRLTDSQREAREKKFDRLEARFQRFMERIGRASELVSLRFERLQLRQQLRGTFDSPGGALARAAFIRRQLIPQERRELRGLRREQRHARREGDRQLAREIGLEIKRQQNGILQLQLDAQNATKEATEATAESMREFGGGIGFQFGGSIMSDRILGSMVGT